MGGLAIYAIGAVGLLFLPYPDLDERNRFGAVSAFLVRDPPHRALCATTLIVISAQLFEMGWSLLFANFIVRDLQTKQPVPSTFRFIGWCTFRASPTYQS